MNQRPSPFRYCPHCAQASQCTSARVFECTHCGFRYFHNVASAVAAFIVHDGQLLLTRRARAPAAGTLDLPGGFVDPAETLEQALARELDEELGLKIGAGDERYLFSLPNIYPYAGVSYTTADSFFGIELVTRPALRALDDVTEVKWMRFADIDAQSIGLASARAAVVRFVREMGG